MIAGRAWALVLLLGAGCGGAPVAPTPSGEVSLQFRPPAGAQYSAHFVVVASALDQSGRVRVTSDVALEVIEVDPSFTTLRAHVVDERIDRPDAPVLLPATVSAERPDVDVRIDGHGRPVGTPLVIAAAASRTLGGYVWGAPAYPVANVRAGALWPAPPLVPWPGESLESTRSGSFRLDEVVRDRAHVSWTVQSSVAPVDHAGTPAHGVLAIDGSTWLALDDGMPRTGALRTTATWEQPPAELAPNLPASVDMSWCVARAGEAPCSPDEQAADSRPAARVYEGAECTSRVTALTASLGSTSDDSSETAPTEPLPVVERGTEPISGRLARVEVASDGSLRLDGRAVANSTVLLRDVDDLRRHWDVLHDGETFPERVRLAAAASAPLSTVVRVLHALGRSLTIELLVDTGRRRERPATPEWVEQMLGAAGPEPSAARVMTALRAASAGCAPLVEAIAALDRPGATARDGTLAATVARHVTACRCQGVDVDALAALLARQTAAPGEGLAVIVLPPETGGTNVIVPRNGTMTDLARALGDRPPPRTAMRVRLH